MAAREPRTLNLGAISKVIICIFAGCSCKGPKPELFEATRSWGSQQDPLRRAAPFLRRRRPGSWQITS